MERILTAVNVGNAEDLSSLLNDNPESGLLIRAELEDKSSNHSEQGFTLLHLASVRGHASCAKVLLENNADASCTTSLTMSSPLHCAALHGHEEVVRLLLTEGADPVCLDSNGRSPLCLARLMKHELVVESMKSWFDDQGYGVGAPMRPHWKCCTDLASICCVTPALRVVIGVRRTSHSFVICEPWHLSSRFKLPTCDHFVEGELPILWVKVRVTAAPISGAKSEAKPLFLIFRTSDMPLTVDRLQPGSL